MCCVFSLSVCCVASDLEYEITLNLDAFSGCKSGDASYEGMPMSVEVLTRVDSVRDITVIK